MARTFKQRPLKKSIAVIVDGKDEKWYLEKIKMHHPSDTLKNAKIKPELPQQKKIDDLFDLAHQKLNEAYSFVILIVDLDEPLKNKEEFKRFTELYEKYLQVKAAGEKSKSRKYSWMTDLLVVINNPCLEYWYLLHFKNTSKFYHSYDEMVGDLHRIPTLKDYNKSEDYYNQSPDIYMRLRDYLPTAMDNSKDFDLNSCHEQGGSDMKLLFRYFD